MNKPALPLAFNSPIDVMAQHFSPFLQRSWTSLDIIYSRNVDVSQIMTTVVIVGKTCHRRERLDCWPSFGNLRLRGSDGTI